MRILLSNSSSEAIYEQIARQVRAQIISGDLEEGALLPSIRALAHDLQISVITTKSDANGKRIGQHSERDEGNQGQVADWDIA